MKPTQKGLKAAEVLSWSFPTSVLLVCENWQLCQEAMGTLNREQILYLGGVEAMKKVAFEFILKNQCAQGRSWGNLEYAKSIHNNSGFSSFLLWNQSVASPHPIPPYMILFQKPNRAYRNSKSICYKRKVKELFFKWFFIHKLDASLQNLLYIAK